MRPSLAMALVLTGCAALVPHDEHQAFDRDAARKVFAAGYSIIQDKYISPVSSKTVAAAGLNGLTTIDPAVKVQISDDFIHLSLPDGVTADLAAPAEDDAQKWAIITARAIEVARAHSKPIGERSSEDIYQAVFKTALAEFDRFSRYLTAAAARSARASREGYGGIGIRLQIDPGRVSIDSVVPDTPAAQAGLQAGDVIVRIDQFEVAPMEESEVVERLRGRVNSPVSLTVARENRTDPMTVALHRAHIVNPTVELEQRDSVALIRLTGFNQATSRQLSRAIERAHTDMGDKMKGVVLDMRDNPGGLLDQAVAVSDFFLTSGRIVSTKGRHAQSMQTYEASGRDQSYDLPLVVLVNGRSASAAEIVAAALQDDSRAVVVGSNTYGKGTVQNLSPLPNDGELVLTWSIYHAPSGYALDNLGILPNVCTSGFKGQPEDVLDQLSPAWTKLPGLMTTWRVAAPADGAKRDAMRANCPRSNESRDFDVEVASKLIADPALYRRALQLTNTTVLAGPLPQSSPVPQQSSPVSQ